MGGAWEALEGSDGALREAPGPWRPLQAPERPCCGPIVVFGLASRPHL